MSQEPTLANALEIAIAVLRESDASNDMDVVDGQAAALLERAKPWILAAEKWCLNSMKWDDGALSPWSESLLRREAQEICVELDAAFRAAQEPK